MNQRDPDEKYIAKCIKVLKSWGAPIEGWKCIGVDDVRADDPDASLATCDLCDCSNVRYVHSMFHPGYFECVDVGCICAGIMEGNILAARERERLLKNRAKRRDNYLQRVWNEVPPGDKYWLEYKGHRLLIRRFGDRYYAYCDDKRKDTYRNKPMLNMLSAKYAAFNMVDPISEVMRQCENVKLSDNW